MKQCVYCGVYAQCAYCGFYGPMTKEHVVPHCYGGRVKILACANCNQQRGHSGKDPRFLKWLETHEDIFRKAVRESADPVRTDTWLQSEGLDQYRLADLNS